MLGLNEKPEAKTSCGASYTNNMISLGGGLDLLAHVPLCASRILFFTMEQEPAVRLYTGWWYRASRRMSERFRHLLTFRYISRLFLLAAVLSFLWYAVMHMTRTTDPALHLFMTFSSMILVSTGKSWGIVEKIIG